MGDPLATEATQTRSGAAGRSTADRNLRMFRDAMQQVLRDMDGNEFAAAQALGVEVQTLRTWLGRSTA